MKTLKLGFRYASTLLVFAIGAFAISCSDESLIGYTDKQSVSSEASSDSYFEDAEDLSFSVASASNADVTNHGRIAGIEDSRLACATLSLSAGATLENGTITINFGEGCTANGVTRKGKIIVTYTGARTTVGSSITVTFDGYYMNGVKIEGTRTVKISEITSTSITHEITLANGKITWPDNSTATRGAHHFRKWNWNGTPFVRNDDTVSLLAEGIVAGVSVAGGTAEGTNRNGSSYTMQITKDIVFKSECFAMKMFLPVQGEKVLNVNGNRTIAVNYGSGNCDNTITVTINGESKEVTVVRD